MKRQEYVILFSDGTKTYCAACDIRRKINVRIPDIKQVCPSGICVSWAGTDFNNTRHIILATIYKCHAKEMNVCHMVCSDCHLQYVIDEYKKRGLHGINTP